ncbi:hypothetical protein Tco_1151883, partial [Tanacetum coccineum]
LGRRGVERKNDKSSVSVDTTKGKKFETSSTPVMMEQRVGMELGAFLSIYEAFANPNTTSMATRISDIER